VAGIEDEGRPVSTRENDEGEETAPPQDPRLGRDDEEVLAHLPPTAIRQWWRGASANGGGAIFRVSVLAVFTGGTRPRGERISRGARRELVRGASLLASRHGDELVGPWRGGRATGVATARR
jgi:hypothetical protein